jgi:HlyD family secretion protein
MFKRGQAGRQWVWRLGLVAVTLVGVGGGFWLWQGAQTVPTIPVERRTLEEIVEVSGAVESLRVVPLKAEAALKVEAFLVNEGGRAKRGDPLLRLDGRMARLQLSQLRANWDSQQARAQTALTVAQSSLVDAQKRQVLQLATARTQRAKSQAQLRFLEAEWGRQSLLAKAGGVSEQALSNLKQQLQQARWDVSLAQDNLDRLETGSEVLQARNQLTQAEVVKTQLESERRAALALAQKAVADTVLRAPFDGTVTAWDTEVGALLTPGMAIGVYQDLVHLRMRLPVDELDLPKLRAGGAVSITFDALPERQFPGVIGDIGRASTSTANNVQVFPVYIDFSDSSGVVRPGMSGDVRIVTATHPDVLAIPLGAVRREGDAVTVSVVREGRPEAVAITPGVSTLSHLEVRAGLQLGDRIVWKAPVVETPKP